MHDAGSQLVEADDDVVIADARGGGAVPVAPLGSVIAAALGPAEFQLHGCLRSEAAPAAR
jgi:hypothetical protein